MQFYYATHLRSRTTSSMPSQSATQNQVVSLGQQCPCTRASTWWGRCSSACSRASLSTGGLAIAARTPSALMVAAGVGVIASSTIYAATLLGGFLAGCGTGLATSAQMALNSRVLSKNGKNEDVSNAKDMGMMSNNTNLAQILATSVNGFLLDYFKEHLTDSR